MCPDQRASVPFILSGGGGADGSGGSCGLRRRLWRLFRRRVSMMIDIIGLHPSSVTPKRLVAAPWIEVHDVAWS